MANNKNITYAQIKDSMLEQLEKNGCKTDFNISLVDDYLFCEKQARKMKTEIRKNGLTVSAVSAQGKNYDKDNPAIKALDMYNKEKLAILKQLGLSIDNIDSEDEDDKDSLL